MNIIMKFIKSSFQRKKKQNINYNVGHINRIAWEVYKANAFCIQPTSKTPSKTFGIREAKMSNSMASSTKCSGIEANAIGQVDGRGILNPPTKPTKNTTINR